jgi:hypothetical protein
LTWAKLVLLVAFLPSPPPPPSRLPLPWCVLDGQRCEVYTRAVAVADQEWVSFTFRDLARELLQVEPGSKS